MNTFLSPAQKTLKEQFEAFALEHVAPVAKELDQRQVGVGEILHQLAAVGYLGLTVPKEYGGQAAPFLHAVLLAEALGQYDPGLVLALAEHLSVIELVAKYGNDSQKSRYLPLLAQGECTGALGFTEETAGSDFAAATTICKKQGDAFTLSGKKLWVVNAQLKGLCVVSARADSKDGGLGLYLVDLGQAQVGPNRDKLGLRSADTNDVEFADQNIGGNALLAPDKGGADEQILHAQDIAKVVLAAGAVGLVESATGLAVQHANERDQFGQKIGQFQAVQWKLADMSAEGAASRLLTYRAGWSKDDDATNFRQYASMCKWYAAKVARLHSGESAQILGAQGLSNETPAERFYRDAKAMEIAEGTSEFQKVLLAQLLGV